jgi:hypothetical protein
MIRCKRQAAFHSALFNYTPLVIRRTDKNKQLTIIKLQTFKIVRGIDRVDSSTWFQFAAQTGRATRSADDPLNLRPKTTRLEVWRNFFSSRVIESWNQVPSTMKNAKTVGGFKREFKKHRAELVTPT